MSAGQTSSDGGVVYEPGWIGSQFNSSFTPATDVYQCVNYTWTSSPAANETKPIDCVTWFDAYGFCIWDHGVLPSDAEYEYAAVGGSRQQRYPWGSTTPGLDFALEVYGCYYPTLSGSCTGLGATLPRLERHRWGLACGARWTSSAT